MDARHEQRVSSGPNIDLWPLQLPPEGRKQIICIKWCLKRWDIFYTIVLIKFKCHICKIFKGSGGQRPSPFLLLVRCTWFCCSGFLGSCGWSVRERQTTRVFPTVWQTPIAGTCLLLAPPAGAAAALQRRPLTRVSSARLCPSSVNNRSSTAKRSTRAFEPQRSWSCLRGAELRATEASVTEMEQRERAWKEEDLLSPTKTLNWKPKQPLTLKHPLDPAA